MFSPGLLSWVWFSESRLPEEFHLEREELAVSEIDDRCVISI